MRRSEGEREGIVVSAENRGHGFVQEYLSFFDGSEGYLRVPAMMSVPNSLEWAGGTANLRQERHRASGFPLLSQ